MDFKQIEALIKVVELDSFSKAAHEMHVSQPSISTYINALEKELGITLINRSTRMVSVTLAGERFLEKAKKMIHLKHEAIEMLKTLSGDVSGEIRILASSAPALYTLPKLFSEFYKLYPGVFFTMSQADTYQVVQGIAAHKADIGFAGSIIGDKKCDFLEFANESLLFIAPNNGTYSENKSYCLKELLYSSGFISREFGSGTRIQYEKYFSENDIMLDKIKTRATMDSTQSIINAVAGGLGISIVSEIAARQMIEQKAVLPIKLKTALPERKIYMVLNKSVSRSHILNLFVEHAMKNA